MTAPGRGTICVALDSGDSDTIRSLAEAVAEHVGVFKVGLTSFVAHGSPLVSSLASLRPVFLDLKLHDIPAQVDGAMRAVAATGASYATVHAAGGESMVQAAVGAAGDVKVIAVTLLTSLADADIDRIGFGGGTRDAVVRLADLALAGGAHGLVCSAHEASELRDRFGAHDSGGPLIVVPGVRPAGWAGDDQRRTTSARDAIEAGADMIVVGRPISAADDPVDAARRFAREVAG